MGLFVIPEDTSTEKMLQSVIDDIHIYLDWKPQHPTNPPIYLLEDFALKILKEVIEKENLNEK